MVACYDHDLAEAEKEVKQEKEESARLRAQVHELAEARKEAEKEKDESARLRAQVERLKNRLRYLKEVEVLSGRIAQIRGTLRILQHFREKAKIDIPRKVIDDMARDLEEHQGQFNKIAEVKLNDEDLL